MSLGMDAANVEQHYNYIAVKQTLELFLADETVVNCLVSMPRLRQDSLYADFTDGEVLAKLQDCDHRNHLLILYQGAFEVTNSLEPSRRIYKTLAVYLRIGNLPGFEITGRSPATCPTVQRQRYQTFR
ncbi:unnamed protein product [Ixodes hexagonus]